MTTIGIDARKIRDYGIGRHLEGLLGALAGLPGPERYVLFLANPDPAALPGDLPARLNPDRFRMVRCEVPLYSVRELLAFRDAPRRHGLALLHFPHYVRPLVHGARVSVSIHDVTHLDWAGSAAARVYARLMIRRALDADTILTGAEAVRSELVARLGARPERVAVVGNGIDAAFAPPTPEEIEEFRRERGLPDDFVLLVGSHRPHKNLRGGVAAWRRAGRPGTLVVPARDKLAARRLAPLLADEPGVHLVREVTDQDLPPLYSAARVVLVPSRAEGFGLPPLEAAACGGAVVAYALPTHVEVLGNAAVLARIDPPKEAEELASALRDLWEDAGRRAELAARGPEHARRFTWRRTAELTLEAWRLALDPRGARQARAG